jgi:ankyrin repeat protein
MMAIFLKYTEAIEYLGKLSNMNICDNNGNTAFIIASANGDI